MKTLIALSVVQLIVLLFFAGRVLSVETQLRDLAQPAQSTSSEKFHANTRSPSPRVAKAAPPHAPSADDIRQIIQEELAALEISALAQPQSGISENASQRPLAPQETRAAMESFDQDLNYFISRGAIDEKEMAQLQQKIASLPPQQRSRALASLVKAINDGKLDGQL